jgi:K+/H+ antiporter YhaU regulatory subunit KhtT
LYDKPQRAQRAQRKKEEEERSDSILNGLATYTVEFMRQNCRLLEVY